MKILSLIRKRVKAFFFLVKWSAIQFNENDVIKYCASLSYYTIFSIAPMLMIAIAVGSILFGKEAVRGQVFGQINEVVGTDAAIMIQEMLKHASLKRDNFGATLLGIIVFFVGATGVFAEIQTSINKIWGLKAKPRKGLIRYIVSRLLSFAMVVTMGFIMVVSLIASTLIEILYDKLDRFLPNTAFIVVVVNDTLSLVTITLLFALVFKYLPDSIVKWKDALVGSLFTSVLFMFGKYLIGIYMANSPSINIYGAAGSIVVVLLWIYYSSILLYFGAEFTKIYALTHGHGIKPNRFSVRIEQHEKEIRQSEP
jgi:membrane protein